VAQQWVFNASQVKGAAGPPHPRLAFVVTYNPPPFLAPLPLYTLQLGRRCCLQLEAHQQRQCFSPLGALRWKRDLSEYGCTAARLRSPAARLRLEELGQAANMLVVGPDSLLPLVDTTLRISHTAALAVIQLRQDYRTARVGEAGASLAALFSSE
jgi:hypothetical protein